jgi:hypothetical protein
MYRLAYAGYVHFDHDVWVSAALLDNNAFQHSVRKDARRLCDFNSHISAPRIAGTNCALSAAKDKPKVRWASVVNRRLRILAGRQGVDEAAIKADWLDFAKRLRPLGMGIFGATPIKITEEGSADIRIIALMLLARTLSNLGAAIVLTESGFVVEAKVIARCCFENSYWVGALVKEGDKFRNAMVQHEMKHKRMGAQTIFSTTATTTDLDDAINDKLRQWMRDHKQYEGSPTLDPKAVAKRAENESYMFYQHLSWDAHPSVQTLNRYFEPPDANGAPGIDVSPTVRDAELIEMLNLMCLAVISVFLGVGDILKQDNTQTGTMAAEYKALTERTAEAGF